MYIITKKVGHLTYYWNDHEKIWYGWKQNATVFEKMLEVVIAMRSLPGSDYIKITDQDFVNR